MVKIMNKREIILDFTSLLDVIMVILFFFIFFSNLETEDTKIALQTELQNAIEREEEAEQKLEEYEKLLEEAQQMEQQAEELLNEANLAGEHQGENVAGIVEFSRNMNIKIKLKMIGSGSWSLIIFKGEEQIDEIPNGKVNEMAARFMNDLSDMGYDKDDTLLCDYLYDATQAGTASADKDVRRVFYMVKEQYNHFFYTEMDISLFGEE